MVFYFITITLLLIFWLILLITVLLLLDGRFFLINYTPDSLELIDLTLETLTKDFFKLNTITR